MLNVPADVMGFILLMLGIFFPLWGEPFLFGATLLERFLYGVKLREFFFGVCEIGKIIVFLLIRILYHSFVPWRLGKHIASTAYRKFTSYL